MYFSYCSLAFVFAASTLARQCTNITIPITITSNNSIFNIAELNINLDATTFMQNETRIGAPFAASALTGTKPLTQKVNIAAQYCRPDSGPSSTVQLLSHGIGFDKSYWDLSFNNFNYSYVSTAVEKFNYSTLAIDRIGSGCSTFPDPLLNVQIPSEVAILNTLTSLLRAGTLPSIPKHKFSKVIHVSHSYASIIALNFAAQYPAASDGLVLTGFSPNASFVPLTFASFNTQLLRINQPLRFGKLSLESQKPISTSFLGALAAKTFVTPEIDEILPKTPLLDLLDGLPGIKSSEAAKDLPSGYLTWADADAFQYSYFAPGNFDPELLFLSEATKNGFSTGEVLTLGAPATGAPKFEGPVLVFTGELDVIFCGGDCKATGNPKLPNIPAGAALAFSSAKAFEAVLQPRTGHGLNVHFNATAGYEVVQNFLGKNGLAA